MPAKGKGSEVVAEYLERFPTAATKTLAIKAYKENPSLWSDVEVCRTAFRRARGNHGERDRNRRADKKFYRPPGNAGDTFSLLPEGKTEYGDWSTFEIEGPGRCLIVSDLHIPYHDRPTIVAAWTEGRSRGVDVLLLNGDILDCFAVSRWENDPRKRDFPGELAAVRSFLEAARACFPKARIVWKIGNHEERYESYMARKAPELLDVDDFQLESLARCKQHGIEVVGDRRRLRLGKLWVLHGHEYKGGMTNPVNPARGLFLRAKANALQGHFHQSSHHSEKDLAEGIVSCWSTGCCCDMHPSYMPLNKWNHGVAFVEVSAGGAFEVDNLRLIDGKLWK